MSQCVMSVESTGVSPRDDFRSLPSPCFFERLRLTPQAATMGTLAEAAGGGPGGGSGTPTWAARSGWR